MFGFNPGFTAIRTDTIQVWTCDNCNAEWWGATHPEIRAAGWKQRQLKHGAFTLCTDCVRHYEPIWQNAA